MKHAFRIGDTVQALKSLPSGSIVEGDIYTITSQSIESNIETTQWIGFVCNYKTDKAISAGLFPNFRATYFKLVRRSNNNYICFNPKNLPNLNP
jgi:hypothetical protein